MVLGSYVLLEPALVLVLGRVLTHTLSHWVAYAIIASKSVRLGVEKSASLLGLHIVKICP